MFKKNELGVHNTYTMQMIATMIAVSCLQPFFLPLMPDIYVRHLLYAEVQAYFTN